MASASGRVEIDFRPFVNRMRYMGEQIEKSVTTPEVRQEILVNVAGSLLVAKGGPDTGATDASIEAIAEGRHIHNEPYSNGEVVRYANAEYHMVDKYLQVEVDPVDENGRHYGQYSVDVESLPTDYNIRYEKGSGIYEAIYDAVRDAITRS